MYEESLSNLAYHCKKILEVELKQEQISENVQTHLAFSTQKKFFTVDVTRWVWNITKTSFFNINIQPAHCMIISSQRANFFCASSNVF